jgi:MFS family permease
MWSRYARVLRAPHVRPLVLASVLARMPVGMVGIALVLFVVHIRGSYAAAGAVTAAFALSAAVLAAVMGRLIDRRGQTLVLLCGTAIHAVAIVALVVLGLSGAPTGVLAACAVAAGALPPISACLRPLWPTLLGRDAGLITAAYALDSILIEVVFTVGPLTTGLLVALFTPQIALLVSVAVVVTGTVWFTAQGPSRAWRGETAGPRHLLGPLVAPGMRTLVVASLAIGICFGTLEVAFAAYGTERGTPGLGGVMMALQALGSAAGGLVYGVAAHRLGLLHHGFLRLLVTVPLLIALLAGAPTIVVFVPLVVISGLVIAPLTAAENQLVGELAPPGALTEAFTWVITATVVGVSIGNAMAGAVVEAASWRAAILVACGLTALGVAWAVTRRRTLEPAPAARAAA